MPTGGGVGVGDPRPTGRPGGPAVDVPGVALPGEVFQRGQSGQVGVQQAAQPVGLGALLSSPIGMLALGALVYFALRK